MSGWTRYGGLAVVAAGVIAYASSFSGAFVLDDAKRISGNPEIRRLRPPERGGWGRSRGLVDLTFALNYAAGKLKTADYHAVNVALHLGCALLLCGIVRRTVARGGCGGGMDAGEAGAVAGCLWVAHPLTSSTVTYIVQRYELMMSLFYLLTIYGLLRGQTGKRGVWYAVSGISCGLGMWCKEVMVTAPALAAVFDRVYLAGSWREMWQKRKWLYAAYGAGWVFLAILMVRGAAEPGIADAGCGEGLSWRYVLTEAQVVLHYLRLAVWPYPLCLDYGWPLVGSFGEAAAAVGVLVAALAGSGVWVWRAPRGGYLAVWFFGILAPTSSVLARPDCAFEHRMYLPLAGVAAGAALGLQGLYAWAAGRWPALRGRVGTVARVGLSFGIAAVLAGATLARNRVYASDETVWRDVVSSRPGNVRARVNLASALYDRGRYDEAMELARSALNLLRGMEKVGHAELLGMEGTPTGGEMFRKAFDYSGAHNTVGLVLQAQGKTEEARGHFTEALRLAPGNVSARSNLGSALYVLGRFEEAMAHWRQALEATPDDAAVHRCVGDACWRTGRGDLAIWHYEAALRVMPDDTLAGTRLAWALATSPRAEWRDGARAVVLAKNAARACDHRSAHVADVLGAAYAECGKFDEAEKAAGLAFALGPGAADAAAIAERLALYRKGMPYRDTTGGGAAERRSRSANGREDVGQSGGQ